MYKNLEAEMIRYDVSNDDIAKVINKNSRTVRNKRAGTTVFTLPEIIAIRDTFFPKLKLEYLFEQTE